MERITIHTRSKEQAALFEQLAKVLKVPFEKTKPEEVSERKKAIKRYGKNFVEKIEASEKNFNEGKYKTIKVEDLWK
ncbi:MAG: hypothetical protein PHI28_02025 [Mangrovibacterium sp.]|nr:hypothetical protein [Mangrovibacterium sp.]